jgi:hypothetical protein
VVVKERRKIGLKKELSYIYREGRKEARKGKKRNGSLVIYLALKL